MHLELGERSRCRGSSEEREEEEEEENGQLSLPRLDYWRNRQRFGKSIPAHKPVGLLKSFPLRKRQADRQSQCQTLRHPHAEMFACMMRAPTLTSVRPLSSTL